MKPDGTARRKVTTERILDAVAVSPDGRWLVAGTPGTDSEHPSVVKAFPLNGGMPIPLCLGFCQLTWDASGKFLFVNVRRLHEGTFPLPVLHDSGLPKLPPAGIARMEDLASAKSLTVIPWYVDSALSPSVYAYTRQDTRRNLYRIPLP